MSKITLSKIVGKSTSKEPVFTFKIECEDRDLINDVKNHIYHELGASGFEVVRDDNGYYDKKEGMNVS